MRKNLFVALLSVLIPAAAMAAEPVTRTPAEAEAVAQMQVMQAYVGSGKRAFIEQQLQLTPEEAEKFWPVYDAHQAALSEFNRRRLDNILAYARVWNSGKIDDAAATALAKEAIAIEKQEAAQLERTFGKLKRAVPAAKAVRYLQVEAKLRAIVRFDQAAQVPFIPGA